LTSHGAPKGAHPECRSWMCGFSLTLT